MENWSEPTLQAILPSDWLDPFISESCEKTLKQLKIKTESHSLKSVYSAVRCFYSLGSLKYILAHAVQFNECNVWEPEYCISEQLTEFKMQIKFSEGHLL